MGYKKGGIENGLPGTHVVNASGSIEPASLGASTFVITDDSRRQSNEGGLVLDGKKVVFVGAFSALTAALVAGCATSETASNRMGIKVQEIKPGLIGDAPKAALQELNEVPMGTIQIGAIDRFSRGQWTLMPDQDGFALGSKLVRNSDGTTSVMYVPQGAMAEDSSGKLAFRDNTQAFVWTGKVDNEDLPKALEDLETSGFARSEVEVLDPISADSLRMGATSISVELIGEKKFGTIHIGAPYLGRGSLSIEVPFIEIQDYVTFGENQKAVDTYFDEIEAIHQQRAEKAASEATETSIATRTPVPDPTPEATRDSGNGLTRNTTETVETVSQPTPLDMAVKLVERYPLETALFLLAVVVLLVSFQQSLKSVKNRKIAEKKEAAAENKLKEAKMREQNAQEHLVKTVKGLDDLASLSDELTKGATDLSRGAAHFDQASEKAAVDLALATARLASESGAASVRARDQSAEAKRKAEKIKERAIAARQSIN